MSSTLTKGTLLVVLSASSYAFLPIFTRLIYQAEDTLTPVAVATWRFIIAVLAVWVVMLVSGGWRNLSKLTRHQIGILLGLGFVFGVCAILAAASLDRVPATTYTLLIYTYPAMVTILNFVLGERLAMTKWLAVGLALVGCSLTISGKIEVNSWVDALFPIVNALGYAIYLTLAGRYNRVGGLPASAISMTGSLIVLLPVSLIAGFHSPESHEGWLPMLGLGTLCTTFAIMLMFAGVNYLGASNAAIISTIEPIMTVILAGLLLSEKITVNQVLGGGLILVSVLLLNMPMPKRRLTQAGSQA